MRGLTQEQLANLVLVEKMSISKYERNQMMPSSSILIALAKNLDVDISYLFREISVQLKAKPEFRINGKLTEKEKKQIISEAEDTLERQLEIMSICQCQNEYIENSPTRRVVQNYDDIETLAEDLRVQWGLGDDPIENLMETAENHGFTVILVNAPENFDAAVFMEEEYGPVIALRRGAPKERQRFTLAHEIGHYCIAKESIDCCELESHVWDKEKMANRFAAALLMPRKPFIRDVGRTRKSLNPQELCLLREKYGASTQSILARMASLSIISRTLKNKMIEADKKIKWSQRPCGAAYLNTESPRLLKRLVLRAVAEGVISEMKGEDLLGADGSFDKYYCPVSGQGVM